VINVPAPAREIGLFEVFLKIPTLLEEQKLRSLHQKQEVATA
jgi:hypothetical protein